MKYYMDCEFNGFGGELISMAFVNQYDRSFYYVNKNYKELGSAKDQWVNDNVITILFNSPHTAIVDKLENLPFHIYAYLLDDMKEHPLPHFIADWPDDIKYLCQSVLTGPGKMMPLNAFNCSIVRVDSYPNNIEGAYQHNAWWDAYCLKYRLSEGQ